MKSFIYGRTRRVIYLAAGLALLHLALLLSSAVVPPGVAAAEGFTTTPFQQQWAATDQAVATGGVSRTYFWGPAPFAHTNEVYAESPNGGQRQVQYFDKARMELSKLGGQEPNYVTNGLLTVELVTGQMQVGDNTFLQRSPATNPVAGDQINNPNTPTYASFNQGKLAFGVAGHISASDRAGQVIGDGVDKAGNVAPLANVPATVRYTDYISQTGHNIADVFYNFFQADPLGSDKWLAVMGYPISEPFWVKDKVIVGGQPRDVLVQLFQRRALTYTPANPAGFQVEMGNIGQHYYVWRYGFNPQDELPGNYRLLVPQDNTLLSIALRNPGDKVSLGTVKDTLLKVYPLGQSGRALVSGKAGLYLSNLTRPGSFVTLSWSDSLRNDPFHSVVNVTTSTDGLHAAVLINSYDGDPDNPDNKVKQTALQIYDFPALAQGLEPATSTTVLSTTLHSYEQATISPDGNYAALFYTYNGQDEFTLVDLQTHTNKVVTFARGEHQYDQFFSGHLQWVGQSHRLFLSLGYYPNNNGVTPGRVVILDDATGAFQTVLQDENLLNASLSPDGNYFIAAISTYQTKETGYLSFRSLANPTTELYRSLNYDTHSNYTGNPNTGPLFAGWSSDGSYVTFYYEVGGPGGLDDDYYKNLSLATGSVIDADHFVTSGHDINYNRLVTPFFVLKVNHSYNPFLKTESKIAVSNFDGSEASTLFTTIDDSLNPAVNLNGIAVTQVRKLR